MVERIATIVITVLSAGLFVYWFRYTCVLILSARTSRNYALKVATDNGLGFVNIHAQLSDTIVITDLDRLRDALDGDYGVVKRLLNHADDLRRIENGLEGRMLAINYRLTRLWYQTGGRFSSAVAREALNQMALIVEYFANSIGEAAAHPSVA